MYDIRPAGNGAPNIKVPLDAVIFDDAVIDVATIREPPLLTVPVNDGPASDAFNARAAITSVDHGFSASEVLSTFPNDAISGVIPT